MAAFPAMTKVRLRTSVLAPDPDPGSQKKVTGRAPSAGACLSHNDVHLGLWSFFFGPINCIPRNLSLGHNAMDKNRSSGPVRPSNAHTLRVSSRFPTPHFTLFFFPSLFLIRPPIFVGLHLSVWRVADAVLWELSTGVRTPHSGSNLLQ